MLIFKLIIFSNYVLIETNMILMLQYQMQIGSHISYMKTIDYL